MPEPWKNRVKKRCAFRPRFFRIFTKNGADLGSQIEGQIAVLGIRRKVAVPFLGSGNWICFQKALQNLPRSILEPPGVDFGGPGSRFGRVRADFWQYLPMIFLARSSSSMNQATRRTKTFRTSNRLPRNVKYRMGGGGAPPPGGFQ